MPKHTRKRRHPNVNNDIEYEIDAPKNKFRAFDEDAQAEEEQLSKILFGGASSFLKSLEEAEQEIGASCSNVDSGVGEDTSDSEPQERIPAWYDEDDDGIEVGHALDAQGRKLPSGGINDRSNKYSSLLKNKFNLIVGTPSWATLDKRHKSQDSDSDEEILHSCGFLRTGTGAYLTRGALEFKKVKDLNCETYSEGPFINAVEFHPTSRVALVGGHNGVASLYAVDGRQNNKLHSVLFQHFPIFCAKFINNGNEVILGSRQNHIFSYDLMAAKTTRIPLPPGMTSFKKFITFPDFDIIAAAGKWGEIHLLSAASKERVATIKQNHEVTALAYGPQGNLLYGHSDCGEVTVWDVSMRRVLHKFMDKGCLQGTTLAVSPTNQFLAAGSAQGVVNLYDVGDILINKVPKPIKTIMNLTTSVTDLKFNATSEILALSSAEIPNSVKLLHVGSGTVFSNFPTFETKLGHVNAINFSPNSGYVAFGNRKSTVSLYTLKHYKSY
ncbi:U3 small nucleolar RNA-associated protein 18 homolog-like Protein [Tribolium castaneum]|uniref:U3 small nucleolar RNA-associated protein 18 homolog-like Protein n=1 Tax=Tribolium castaneum TaxID=7070 RepID=D6WBP4_TRICA|nr:PREDICTED: U3 small nucleolar RNA-associated protein 18 homolog [Tribolium castaneum]EEZ97885.1 U3 small nucleolar RNA-associated protein 18 homolog-like Protein [Tribolium castaneum]|eukprot:XP_966624.1 PREDICTED: U3 small nucleolar RNA-associated protein 18 homolog [Tribolium castaneum]